MTKTSSMLALLSAAGLLVMSGIGQSAYAQESTAKINYAIDIGRQMHLVHFTVCANDEKITNPQVILESPQETKKITLKKVIPSNTCQSYEMTIKAKHANKISMEIT